MRSLAIDASTGVLALALRTQDATATFTLRRVPQHATVLLPSVQELLGHLGLKPADLELIVCSTGPGSFTGIRIGLAAAKGLAFGIPCPLVGVSSLDAFALPFAAFDGDVYPVIDARKGKVYTALYRGGGRLSGYLDLTYAELLKRAGDPGRVLLAGPDARDIRLRLEEIGGADLGEGLKAASYTDPLALLEVGEREYARSGADPRGLVPLYLRKSEAEIGAGL